MKTDVKGLVKDLETYIELLAECGCSADKILPDKAIPVELQSATEKASAQRWKLVESAKKVIEEATKIKTRDIS